MTRALLVACAATLLACRGRDRTPVADSPLADSLSAAVGLLRAGMTLGAWIEAHPADSLIEANGSYRMRQQANQ